MPSEHDIIRYILPLISALLGAAVGWWLKRNESIDSELAKRIDDIVDELSIIEKCGIEIWENFDDSCPTLARGKISAIEGRLHRIACLVDDIADGIPNVETYNIPKILRNLRISCTDDGDGPNTLNLPIGPERVKTIILAATEMMRTLRNMRRSVMPQKIRSKLARLLRLNAAEPEEPYPAYWSR